jgi:hypothetical protein
MSWLAWLWRKIIRFFLSAPVPPSVVPVLNGEVFMPDVRDGLVYSVEVPALPSEGDLSSQELCVHYDGNKNKIAVDAAGGSVSFMVPQDADAGIHLVYIDNGGNESEGPLFSFKAIDTINTFTPPGFGEVKLVEEVFGVYWEDE